MKPKELLLKVAKSLEEGGIEDARFDAQQLIIHLTHLSEAELLFGNNDIADCLVSQIEALAERRIGGEPLQYILGLWEFYSLPFFVGQGVLIPRAETELLVFQALEFLKNKENCDIADLCSGSGAIAIAIDKNTSSHKIEAFEKYDEAFNYLEKNIALNSSLVVPIKRDISSPERKKYDLILSNPPYIKDAAMRELQKEVTFEPETALAGGADGLLFYRIICEKWVPLLRPKGALMVEIGFDEGEEVKTLFEQCGLTDISCIKDLNGLDRVIIGTMNA